MMNPNTLTHTHRIIKTITRAMSLIAISQKLAEVQDILSGASKCIQLSKRSSKELKGKWIALHVSNKDASNTDSQAKNAQTSASSKNSNPNSPELLQRSIVALIHIKRVVRANKLEGKTVNRADEKAKSNPFCLVLDEMLPLDRPVFCKGGKSPWEVPADKASAVIARLGQNAPAEFQQQQQNDNDDDNDNDNEEEDIADDDAQIDDTENYHDHTDISSKERKRRISLCNHRLAEYATEKKLEEALKEFDILTRLGATVHSYTSIINACARCNETDRALRFLRMAQSEQIAPNVATFTAVIKALSQSGRLAEAFEIYTECVNAGCDPNIRTVDTLLRGCVRWGDAKLGKKMWVEMSKRKIQPSQSSYEAMIRILCETLQLDEAWGAALEMQQKNLAENTASFALLAVVSALMGDSEQARKAAAISEMVMSQDTAAAAAGGGGKKQKKSKGNKKKRAGDWHDDQRSYIMFNRMKKREAKRWCQEVKCFLPLVESGEHIPPVNFQRGKDEPKFVFLPKPWVPGYSTAAESNKRKVQAFDPRDLFENRKLPIRMEVCSGSGEWIVSRAEDDPLSNWLALEVRYDRAFDAWCAATLRSVKNVAVICGDARQVLLQCLPRSSIAEFFVNFPEPPVWDGGSQHLLDESFWRSVHAAVEPFAKINLLSDDENYSVKVANIIQKQSELFNNATTDPSGCWLSSLVPESYGAGRSYFDRLWQNGERGQRYFLSIEAIKALN